MKKRYFTIKIPRPNFIDKFFIICLLPLIFTIPLIVKIQRYRWKDKPDTYTKRQIMMCLDADNSIKTSLLRWWESLKQ
jgi:hypothetical protein